MRRIRYRSNSGSHHERWLISYADFITLLFALFVVLFASAQADKGRAGAVAESVRQALEHDRFSAIVASLWGGTANDRGRGNAMLKGPGGTTPEVRPVTNREIGEFTPTLAYLRTALEEELATSKIEVRNELRGLVVSLAQAAFFPTGENSIDPRMYATLDKLAAIIASTPNSVRLEGHTDTVPIHNTRFSSNWELSSARSLAVFEFFTRRSGLPQERFAISGHAHTVPADTNETEAGRARNRRVDIVLLSRFGRLNEPSPRDPERH
jgi:chemotaxis protein MotB